MFDDIFEEFNLIHKTSVKETQHETKVKKILLKISFASMGIFYIIIGWLLFSIIFSHGENPSFNPEGLPAKLMIISLVVFLVSSAISIAIFSKEYIFKENSTRRKSSGRSKADTFSFLVVISLVVFFAYTILTKGGQTNDPIALSIFSFSIIIIPISYIFSIAEKDENVISIDNTLWKTINDKTRKMLIDKFPLMFTTEGLQWIIDTSQNRYNHTFLIEYFYDWIGSLIQTVTIAGSSMIIVNIGMNRPDDWELGFLGRWIMVIIIIEYILFLASVVITGFRKKEHLSKLMLLVFIEHLSYIKMDR